MFFLLQITSFMIITPYVCTTSELDGFCGNGLDLVVVVVHELQ
jgi:hypothetical protein